MNVNLLTVREIAERCNLPVHWVKREAQSGRLPHLRAGRRMLFNLAAVRAELTERAKREGVTRGQ
jgi:excisionase family DNA binding protein